MNEAQGLEAFARPGSIDKDDPLYLLLFEKMQNAFAYGRVVFEGERPVDVTYLSANRSFERITGLHGVSGRRLSDIYPSFRSEAPGLLDAYARVCLSGKPERFEWYIESRDEWLDINVHSPEQGFFISEFQSITERKRAESMREASLTELKEAIMNLNQSQEISHVGSWSWDLGESPFKASPEALRMLGLPAESKPFLPEVLRCFRPEDRQRLQAGLHELISLGGQKSLEVSLGRPGSAELRTIIVTGRLETFPDGSPKRVYGLNQDISEKRKADESLARAGRLESLAVLAGGIAHDFNNLLSGLFGFIELASFSLEAGSLTEAQAFLADASEVFERGKALAQQLLTFAKGGAPQLRSTDIGSLLRRCSQFALAGSHLSPLLDIEEGLWPCECDENQMSQVFDNMLINAKQAMPSGGSLWISAKNQTRPRSAKHAGRYVQVLIRDQGIGMSRETLAHLFDPFFSTKSEGHGLGLAIAYSIVQRHKGWIDVESELGKGSSFAVFLPVSDKAPESSAELGAADTGTQAAQRGDVLVMDDEASIRRIYASLLSALGFSVSEAADDAQALSAFSRALEAGRPPLLCILDLTIPGSSGGLAVLEGIRKLNPHQAVLVASGYSDNPVMVEPLRYGFNGAIAKPFRKKDIEAALAALGL